MTGLFEAIGITLNPKVALFKDTVQKPQSSAASEREYVCISPLLFLLSNLKSVKILLGGLKYKEYCWEVIRDLKIVPFSKAVLPSILVSFASGIAGTPAN